MIVFKLIVEILIFLFGIKCGAASIRKLFQSTVDVSLFCNLIGAIAALVYFACRGGGLV